MKPISLIVLAATFACAGKLDTRTVAVVPYDARLHAELVAADLSWEAAGVDPDEVIVLSPDSVEEGSIPATWSSCFDSPDASLLIFDADSAQLGEDVYEGIGWLL